MKTSLLILLIATSFSSQAFLGKRRKQNSTVCRADMNRMLRAYVQTQLALLDEKLSEKSYQRILKMQERGARTAALGCSLPSLYANRVKRAEKIHADNMAYYYTVKNNFDRRLESANRSVDNGRISYAAYETMLRELAADHGVER